MNGKELLTKLQQLLDENNITARQFAYNEWDGDVDNQITTTFGEYYAFGPERTEGGGDYDGAQSVFHFKDHNVYISVEGSYSSWEGYDWDTGMYVVEPVEIKTTIYKIVS